VSRARSRFYAPTYDTSKRKVIQYIDYANDYDTANGHGTHVCGTVAGAYSTAADNGHAEGAKIAFFDMSIDGSSIFYPTPIDSFVFRPAFLAGAKIHSNSWGSALNLYQEQEINVDSYHLEEDQFLALFAAGNEGDAGYFSVGSPAVSKNAMAIGASRASSSSGTSFAGPMDEVAYFSSLGPTFDMRIKPDVVAPGSYVSSAAASGSVDFTCSTLTMQGTSMATPGAHLCLTVSLSLSRYFSRPLLPFVQSQSQSLGLYLSSLHFYYCC
jgi:subtilisin family serine protease